MPMPALPESFWEMFCSSLGKQTNKIKIKTSLTNDVTKGREHEIGVVKIKLQINLFEE